MQDGSYRNESLANYLCSKIVLQESHEHESSKQQRRKRKSLKPRIELLVFVSILAAVVCSGFLLYDVLGMRLLENTRKSTHSYTTILLVCSLIIARLVVSNTSVYG